MGERSDECKRLDRCGHKGILWSCHLDESLKPFDTVLYTPSFRLRPIVSNDMRYLFLLLSSSEELRKINTFSHISTLSIPVSSTIQHFLYPESHLQNSELNFSKMLRDPIVVQKRLDELNLQRHSAFLI